MMKTSDITAQHELDSLNELLRADTAGSMTDSVYTLLIERRSQVKKELAAPVAQEILRNKMIEMFGPFSDLGEDGEPFPENEQMEFDLND